MNEQKRFNVIAKAIKEVKIQGARNIAKQALYAYSLIPTTSSKKKLLSLRPTEPMLRNVLNKIGIEPYSTILEHFDCAQQKINSNVLEIIKNRDIIFTHCHSTNVVNSLVFARKKGISFRVYNTETRPLFQGRRTARELETAGIKVTMFIDSALEMPLSGEQGIHKAKKVFLGADALLSDGIINKTGSMLIAQIAKDNHIPVYIIADSWKFSYHKIPIEQRGLNEVWDNAPKHIKIKNPAFEFVPKKYIKAIISELGILSYDKFVRKVKSSD